MEDTSVAKQAAGPSPRAADHPDRAGWLCGRLVWGAARIRSIAPVDIEPVRRAKTPINKNRKIGKKSDRDIWKKALFLEVV
jgi:hypothetical protein